MRYYYIPTNVAKVKTTDNAKCGQGYRARTHILLVECKWYRHTLFPFCFFGPCHLACGISVSQPGIEPGPRQWKPGILTTRPPGNSLGTPYFTVLWLVLCRYCIFYKLKFCGNLCQASLFTSFFQQHLLTSCLCVIFLKYFKLFNGNSSNISNFLMIIIFVVVICDQWSLPFLFFWPHREACGILVPQPEMEPEPPTAEARRPNHCTTREFPVISDLWCYYCNCFEAQRTTPT